MRPCRRWRHCGLPPGRWTIGPTSRCHTSCSNHRLWHALFVGQSALANPPMVVAHQNEDVFAIRLMTDHAIPKWCVHLVLPRMVVVEVVDV